MTQDYQPPTPFGIMYAHRLFTEVGGNDYQKFCDRIGTRPNLENDDHSEALLNWLNKWGCRIDNSLFVSLKLQMAKLVYDQALKLPDLTILTDQDFEMLERVYGEICAIKGLGSTAASKILFAMYPTAAIPWDAPIRKSFGLDETHASYRAMLSRSQQEARKLRDEGLCLQRADWVKGLRTWPLLLDNYNWVTITRKHKIPTSEELEKWVNWAKSFR
jgi:hypothetical protein